MGKEDKNKLGLVLEGGGMRGMYTAGVLDEFMLNDIWPDGIAGVSAGILHSLSYLAEQFGRDAQYYVKYRSDKRFMSLYNIIRTGDICDEEFCYHEIPDKLKLFDYDKFAENAAKIEVYSVASNLETGKAEYLRIKDAREDIEAIRASASLPMLSKIVEYDGMKLLDGGTADSIPVKAMMNKGFSKNIVVLTRPDGYVKKHDSTMPIMKVMYRDYPKFVETAENRHISYNKTIEEINRLEKSGEAFVIKPSRSIKIGRAERDIEKIKRIYKLGRFDARNCMEKLKEFVEEARATGEADE